MLPRRSCRSIRGWKRRLHRPTGAVGWGLVGRLPCYPFGRNGDRPSLLRYCQAVAELSRGRTPCRFSNLSMTALPLCGLDDAPNNSQRGLSPAAT